MAQHAPEIAASLASEMQLDLATTTALVGDKACCRCSYVAEPVCSVDISSTSLMRMNVLLGAEDTPVRSLGHGG